MIAVDRATVITIPARWPSGHRLVARQFRALGIEATPFVNGPAGSLPPGVPGRANEGSPPAHFRGRAGSWWHLQAFREVVRRADEDGVGTLLVLEDDVLLTPGAAALLARLDPPGGWELFYLGAYHGYAAGRNERLAPDLLRVRGSQATHALLCHRRSFAPLLAMPADLPTDSAIADHVHPRGHSYATWPSVALQAPGTSSITGEMGGDAALWAADGVLTLPAPTCPAGTATWPTAA